MLHLSYLALLAACLVGTAPLEFVLKTGVYRRWRLLLLSLAPGGLAGIGWDVWAAHAGHWSFDGRYLLGLRIAGLPIEEWLFFLVIPTCAVLTLEAVRRRRPGWLIGDEVDAKVAVEPDESGQSGQRRWPRTRR